MNLDAFFDRLIRFFASLRLTVVCLTLGILLVLFGTLAQVDLGLYRAQSEFFRSFLVFWGPKGAGWKMPVFPGGYLVGGLLLINLVTAFFTRFRLERSKAGILLVHFGLILLLVGQLLTDVLSRESAMQLFEGEAKNYSEDFRATELAVIDKSDTQDDMVYAIPEELLVGGGEIRDSRLPFPLKQTRYWRNAALVQADGKQPPEAVLSGATAGWLKDILVIPQATESDTDRRNTPAAVIEVGEGKEGAGSFLVSPLATRNQTFRLGGKSYEIALRPTRYYYPFSVSLLKATHEKYKGTDIPRNFASRVRVQNPDRNEARETVIYMNNPLRYGGQTFYQYQMSAGEMAQQQGMAASSTFQVVRNPGWLTPYLSCVLISIGLLVQFGAHLAGFVKRRAA